MNFRIAQPGLPTTVAKIADYLRSEHGREVSPLLIRDALQEWLMRRLDRLAEDLAETLTTPGRAEAAEFAGIVERKEKEIYEFRKAEPATEEISVFTGNRAFAFEKLAAMTTYIASRGRDVFKTKLNKLLFYSDFVHFYDHGTSISGSRYVHLPYGPVPDRFEGMLAKLSATDAIKAERGPGFEIIRAGDEPIIDSLSEAERKSIDWVLETYGALSARDISEQSHREKAYKFTRPGEAIAYEYAKFFETLPDN